MADEASGFTDSIKANRWLGFIQGVLWAFGMKSVESIDEDNKPLGDWYTAVVQVIDDNGPIEAIIFKAEDCSDLKRVAYDLVYEKYGDTFRLLTIFKGELTPCA